MAITDNEFSFEKKRIMAEYNPYTPMTEEELLTKLEVSRQHAEQGKYQDADAVASNMRAKYGL